MWRDYLLFYDTSMPAEVYDRNWAHVMGDGPLHGLAARADDALVGLTHFLFHASGWTMTPVCYLQDLYVDPAARGTGAGRALIEAVAARAQAAGTTRLYWLTQDHNAPARLLYDRLANHTGFIRYEYPLGG
ncbi:MAG: GNAT family N-acetyltransferase [Gemmatimonadaceae bacterium]|nr:GNAT family N-acetyltransferase [Acetobacteraceae bacterium]